MIKISYCSIFKGENKDNFEIKQDEKFPTNVTQNKHIFINFKQNKNAERILPNNPSANGVTAYGGSLSLLHAVQNPRTNIINPCHTSDALQVVS